MKAFILLVICLTTLILPSTSRAFKFDIWESGIKLEEAYKLANSKSIRLRESNNNVVVRGIKFNIFDQTTNLFGKTAIIRLYFSAITKILYKIEIKWQTNITENDYKKLNFNIETALNKKYGNFDISLRDAQIFANKKLINCESKISTKSTESDDIRLESTKCRKQINLTYTNKMLNKMNNTEHEILEQQTKENVSEDSKKF